MEEVSAGRHLSVFRSGGVSFGPIVAVTCAGLAVLEYTGLLSLPVTCFLVGAFIVLPLALGDSKLYFDPAF